MPTDGADFQRRRLHHGKFYVDVKNGADVAHLAQVAVMCVAREITHDRKMPMLKPLIDAVVRLQPGTHLFSSTSLFASQVTDALKDAGRGFPDDEAKRACESAVYRHAMTLRVAAANMDTAEFRAELLGGTGHELVQRQSLDPADGYLRAHRKLDQSEHRDFEAEIHAHADRQTQAMMESIYDRPSGTPSNQFRKLPDGAIRIKSDSPESLQKTVLQPSDDWSE